MLSFAIVSLSRCSAAISSSTGATILHGPHHSAQKSTSTGLSLPRTSLANEASVTVLVLAPTEGLLHTSDLVVRLVASKALSADELFPQTLDTAARLAPAPLSSRSAR